VTQERDFLKVWRRTSRGPHHEVPSDSCPCRSLPVRLMCRTLAVSPSSYYAWAIRPRVAAQQRIDGWSLKSGDPRGVAENIRQSRVHATLQARGQRWANTVSLGSCAQAPSAPRWLRSGGPPRIRRIRIRSYRTRSIASSRWPRPTGYGLGHHLYLDRGRLAVSGGGAGPLLAPGHCLGMGSRLTQELVAGTLTMAVERRRLRAACCITRTVVPVRRHHVPRVAGWSWSDGEHESARELLDNAVVESFLHTLKTEHVHHQRYRTREEARQDIFEWIEVFYNRVRRHSTLGYRSPPSSKRWRRALNPVSVKSGKIKALTARDMQDHYASSVVSIRVSR